MTVSRVVNSEGSVKPTTAARVRAAIAALRFSPNPAARSLVRRQRLRLGFVHLNPSVSYLGELLVGALQAAMACDAHLLVESVGSVTEPLNSIGHMLGSGINGLIIPPPLCYVPAVVERIEKSGVPAVAVSSAAAPSKGWAIGIDDRAAARDMVAHLVALGHRRIGYIHGKPAALEGGRRMSGYLDGLVLAGIPEDQALIAPGTFTYRSGLDAAERLLSLPEPPSAIFAANDEMAAAVVATAHRAGLDVPGKVSVCGFDDTPLATAIWPELTTIRQPLAGMGRRAVELLARAINGNDVPPFGVITLEHQLVRRHSDAAPRRQSSS